MKKFTFIALAAGIVLTSRSQVVFTENFTSPFNPSTNGWSIQNLSASANPTLAWFQGNGAAFPAFNGGVNDYYAVNFNSTTDANPATISDWLITPTLNLTNGAVLEFATRTTTNPSPFPDRLEVYMSTAGTGTNVGSTPTSLGTFSIHMITINPSLTATGYPSAWTIYTVAVSGLGSPTLGRFGFRYHVTNAGPATAAANSDYIGVDAVKYSMPCGVTVQSYTTCVGQSVTLTATGGGTNTTYTWTPGGSNSSSITVTAGTTTQYTVSYTESGSQCPDQTATVTVGPNLNVNVTASSNTICSGASATLTASGPATSYTWSTFQQSTSIVVTPSTTTSYSVGGSSGFCFGGNTIQITVLPTPTITANLSPSIVCTNSSYTLSATGGASYFWLVTPSSGYTQNPVVLTPTLAGGRSYTLVAFGTNGCGIGLLINFTVNPSPTITAVASRSVACVNEVVTFTASGGSSYSWSGAGTSTANPYSWNTGTSTGSKTLIATGLSPEGCASSFTTAVTVNQCAGLSQHAAYANFAIFPNPFVNEIRVSGMTGTVEIYNMLGQVVIRHSVNEVQSINTLELPKGAYMLKATDGSGELIKLMSLIKN